MWKWANYVHAEAARVGRKALLVNLDETSIPVKAAPRGAVVRYDAEGRRKLKTGPKLGHKSGYYRSPKNVASFVARKWPLFWVPLLGRGGLPNCAPWAPFWCPSHLPDLLECDLFTPRQSR